MSKKDKNPVFGNRIPRDYFVAMGRGQINKGSGKDPWETGSYDLALLDAGIENFNIVEYTSVLPPESREICIDDAKRWFRHGAVLETIMASVNGHLGERLCAGVGTIQVRRESDGKHIGGFAAEYEGYADEKTANKILKRSLRGIVERRNKSLGDDDQLIPFDEKTHVKDFFVEENYGTVLVAICFVNYIYPLLEEA
jgi:arginine decarboxylase